MTFNPHKHALRQFKSMLAGEADFTHEDKERNQWQLMVKFCDTQIVVGKGHINTAFLIYDGNVEKRKVAMPHEIISLLRRLAAQPFPLYALMQDGIEMRRFQSLRPVIAKDPKRKGSIYGIALDGERTLCYKARANVAGKLTWIKV